MKKGIVFALILFSALAAKSNRVGYVVAVLDTRAVDVRYFKTQNVEKVEQSITTNTGLDLRLHEVISGGNVFFEYRTNDVHFYVEKKKVKRKKNGKLVYKKLSKKERKELESEQVRMALAAKKQEMHLTPSAQQIELIN